jgi:hypothetical protein
VPCCKAEKYAWCINQPTVYTDEEGKKYCVFHAPQEKGQTPDNFNRIVYERIQNAIDNVEYCILMGTIFPWNITFEHFKKDNPVSSVDFRFTTFSGFINFDGATFSGGITRAARQVYSGCSPWPWFSACRCRVCAAYYDYRTAGAPGDIVPGTTCLGGFSVGLNAGPPTEKSTIW